MEYFTIEYARMRQKEIEREIAAINAARMAGSEGLNPRSGEVRVKWGSMLVHWGRRLKRRLQKHRRSEPEIMEAGFLRAHSHQPR
jgi:hypothetical protein